MKNNETLTKGIIDHNVNYRVSGTRGYFLLPRQLYLKGHSYVLKLYQLNIYVTIFYANCTIFINISEIINLSRSVIR